MRRFLAAAGLGTTIAWLALPGSPALACTCDALPLHAHLEAADAVFRGRVVSVAHDGAEQHASVRVVRVYKGSVDSSTIALRTAASPETCGIQFGRETEYLVFARAAAGGFTTSLCAGTTDDVSALERTGIAGRDVASAALGAPPPVSVPKAKPRTLPIAAAATILGSVFAVHARRFARTQV